jgi:hypothetical protein
LKNDLAKSSTPIGEKLLNDLLSNQRSNNVKEGLDYVSKAKKKESNPAQAKKNPIVGGFATRGKATHDDFAGITNPHYFLFHDYYGDVYAKYVGTYDSYIARYIWVPKTLITNKRGPIEKWVPKTKP